MRVNLSVRTCSIPVPSLLIWWCQIKNHPSYRTKMTCRSGQLRKSSFFTHFTNSATVLLAMLHIITEPFLNGPFETNNQLVQMKNGLGTLQTSIYSKNSATCWHVFSTYSNRKYWTFWTTFFHLCQILVFSSFEKSFDFLLKLQFILSQLGISTLVSLFDGLRLLIFCRKME